MVRSLIRARAFRHWVLGLSLLTAGASGAVTKERRLIDLGLERAPGVGEEAHRTLDDTVHAQLQRAAAERGFKLVSLERVMGLQAEIRACLSADCRLRSLARVKATHVVRGRVSPSAGGYAVTVFLEDARTGAFLSGAEQRGSIVDVQDELRASVDQLLESAAPRDAVARERLTTTARSYAAKGRYEDAARTLARAASVNPFHPDAPVLLLDAIDLKLRTADEAGAWDDTVALLDSHGPRSAWSMAQIGGVDHVARVEERQRARVFDLATATLERATAQGASPDQVEAALVRWRVYLDRFSDDEAAPLAELYVGELLFSRKQWVDAAAHYVTARDSAIDDDSRELAAASVVFALEHELLAAIARGDAAAVDLTGATTLAAESTELSPAGLSYVEAIDRLVADFPRHADASSFAYRAAHLYAARGDRAEATRRLSVVVATWPRAKAARAAKKTAKSFTRSR
jgi:TolA-binding protein